MNDNTEFQARTRLAYQVGGLQGFLKYGLPYLSSIKIKDRAAFDAAIAVAIRQIEEEATAHSLK